MELPLPIVVDADVLIRNVDYAARKGYDPALIGWASESYTLSSGVVVFATARVGGEVIRHLPEIAQRRGKSRAEIVRIWNEVIVPHVRFVNVDDRAIRDDGVDAVRALHAADAPTAALGIMLAPAVLLTNNHRHFRPLLGVDPVNVDEAAVAAYQLGEFGTGMSAVIMVGGLAVTALFGGGNKLVRAVGPDGALVVALVALALGVVYWQGGPGNRHRAAMGALAREIGPHAAAAFEKAEAASEQIAQVMIEAPEKRGLLSFVARELATGQPIMKTVEIARRLRLDGYRLTESGASDAQVRAWLVGNKCFHEVWRGNWSLGYHAGPLE